MSIGDVIKQNSSQPALDALPAEQQPAWATGGHALIPSMQNGQQGFDLPNIESEKLATGEKNPYYIPKTKLDANGKEVVNPDYQDAVAVHDAFNQLDALHQAANPHIDYAKEYSDVMAAQQKVNTQKPRYNPLVAFGIGLGAGQGGQQTYAQNAANQDQADLEQANKAIEFKKALVDAHIKELVTEGKWKDALRQSEVSTRLDNQLKMHQDALKHQYTMEENAALIGGRKDVAGIRAEAMVRAVNARVKHSGSGLQGAFLDAFNKQMGKDLADLTKGIMNDPESGMANADAIVSKADQISKQLAAQQAASGATGVTKNGKIRIKLADGTPGTIPGDKVDAFLKAHPGAVRLP